MRKSRNNAAGGFGPQFFVLAVLLVAGIMRFWQLATLPPGLHYDLAANALLTNEIAGGARPIFIIGYTGKEVLFFYSAALLYKLIGPSVFALRLTAAFWGLLSIPTAAFAIRQVSAHWPGRHWLGSYGAAILAALFMHVVWSRFGFRVITEPVVQALALGFLFRGLRHHRLSDMALAGAFTGLAAYTYLAARLFPVPLAVTLLVLLVATVAQRNERQQLNPRLLQLLLFGGAALLVFAPLGWFFLQHPETFFTRISQVAPREGESNLIIRGILGSLGMLFVRGEPYIRFNIPNRPIFDLLQGTLFVIGLAVSLWRLPRLRKPVDIAAEALLLVWVPVMLLPTALAVHEIFPSNVRAFGLLPLVLVYPARGLLSIVQGVQSRRSSPALPLAAGTLLLAAGAAITGVDYFARWAPAEVLQAENDGDLVAAAGYLNSLDLDGTTVYMSAIHYRHPTLAFLARDYERIKWFTGGNTLAVPAEGPALYIFPASGPQPAEWLAGWDDAIVHQQPGPAGFTAYRFAHSGDVPLPALTPVSANFSYIAELQGVNTETVDGQLRVDLRLRVLNMPDAPDMQPYLRLVGPDGFVWAQTERFAYVSEQWSAGDTILMRLTLDLPPGLPPDDYTLRAGLFSPLTGANLAVINPDGSYGGQRATAATVRLDTTARDHGTALSASPMRFDPPTDLLQSGDLVLYAAQLDQTRLRQGETGTVALLWHMTGDTLPATPPVLRLGNLALATRIGADTAPFGTMIDRQPVPVPLDAQPGPHDLTLSIAGRRVTLGTIDILPVERSYALPGDYTATSAVFTRNAEEVTLAGYRIVPGATTTIDLAWQPATRLGQDDTVFVHILDEAGTLVAQRDAQPRDGGYPTSLWAPGEVITDSAAFDLAPGSYQLALGLYDPEYGHYFALPDGSTRLVVASFEVE